MDTRSRATPHGRGAAAALGLGRQEAGVPPPAACALVDEGRDARPRFRGARRARGEDSAGRAVTLRLPTPEMVADALDSIGSCRRR